MIEEREDEVARSLLRRLPGPAPGAAIRVRGRLQRARRAPDTLAMAIRRLALPVVGVMAAAAALTLAIPPFEAPMAPQLPPPAQLALASSEGWVTNALIPGVDLSFEGTGQIYGSPTAPRIKWDIGTIHVEVAPDKGIHLAVLTRDAEVRVIGTGFTVERDALGTRVAVQHGIVEVDCSGQATVRLLTGDVRTCLPSTAGGLIGRAGKQKDIGAPAEAVLATLDAGLALAGSQRAYRDVLNASRIETLIDLGRRDEALSAARLYLADADALRRVEVLSLATSAARLEGGCAQSAPWILDLGPAAIAGCE